MHITLINPNIITQPTDFFSSGIPYMPVTLAYAAAWLQQVGHTLTVIDAFGEMPKRVWAKGNFYFQGLSPQEVCRRVPQETRAIIFYASLVYCHESLRELIAQLRVHYPAIPFLVLENTQSVNAYSLQQVPNEFFSVGADYLVIGEPEPCLEKIMFALGDKEAMEKIDGLIFLKGGDIVINRPIEIAKDLDTLPFPAWDLFPLENYWKLGYAHGPLTGKRYLPLLTSRGCPYVCTFCIIPETNSVRWRKRSAKNVVDEMEFFHHKYHITEYHLEDLNPTIDRKRMQEIAEEIMKRSLPLTWKLAAGSKIETIDKETIDKMVMGGCTFFSLSPESGSPAVLKQMKKPFFHDYALELVTHLEAKKGVSTQACFVLGHPGEGEKEREETRQYIRKLAKAGIDEIALFIMTPIPGSSIYKDKALAAYHSLSELTFSPKWRKDYHSLSRFRWQTYCLFLLWRIQYHPIMAMKQMMSFLRGTFATKMEMTVYRTFCIRWYRFLSIVRELLPFV